MGTASHHDRAARRRVLVASLALSLLSPVLASAPRADAAVQFKEFTSAPMRVFRNGVPYDVRVSASRAGADSGIQITFIHERDPDGVVRGQRTAGFGKEATFWVDDALANGVLRVGDAAMGARGTVDLTWSPSTALDRSCSGDVADRRGVLTGEFVFDTNTEELGTIRFDRLPGVMRRSTSNACRTGVNACPAQTIVISGGDGPASAFAVRSGTFANVSAFAVSFLANGWARVQSVTGRVPSDRVTLSQDERQGSVRGARGSFFSGENTFRSFTDSETTVGRCGADRQFTHQSNDGRFSGDLEADTILGRDLTFDGFGDATRVTVESPRHPRRRQPSGSAVRTASAIAASTSAPSPTMPSTTARTR